MICVPMLQDHFLHIKHEQMAQGIWMFKNHFKKHNQKKQKQW